jgi:hypothetical protein
VSLFVIGGSSQPYPLSVTLASIQAATSAGLAIKSSNGTTVATIGAGPGTGVTFAGGVNAQAIAGTTLTAGVHLIENGADSNSLSIRGGNATISLIQYAGSTGTILGYAGCIGADTWKVVSASGAAVPLEVTVAAPGPAGPGQVLIGGGEVKAAGGVTCTALISTNAYISVDKTWNSFEGAIVVQSQSLPNRQCIFGYDVGVDKAYIQSVHQGYNIRPLMLNPNGGTIECGGEINAAGGVTCTTLTASGVARFGSSSSALSLLATSDDQGIISAGAYYNGSNWISTTTGSAKQIDLVSGGAVTRFNFAAGGSVGGTIAAWTTAFEISGLSLSTGAVSVEYTTASTSTTTGSATFAGGIGVAGRVSATEFASGTTKVIGTQGAAVADATDATSVIARLNDLLARCRAHGLIAT